VAVLRHKGEWADIFDISGYLIQKRVKKVGKSTVYLRWFYERWEV